MIHFSADNTKGYSDQQLTEANKIMDRWCAGVGFDPRHPGVSALGMDDLYKQVCERALLAVGGRPGELDPADLGKPSW